jgi:ATP-dependent DNA ligase
MQAQLKPHALRAARRSGRTNTAWHGVPEGAEWVAEGKLDGWRIVAHKTQGGVVHAYSRGGDDYGQRIPSVVEARSRCCRTTPCSTAS